VPYIRPTQLTTISYSVDGDVRAQERLDRSSSASRSRLVIESAETKSKARSDGAALGSLRVRSTITERVRSTTVQSAAKKSTPR
jgi:hypothetical protein